MDNIFNVDGTKKDNVNIQNAIYEMKSNLPLLLEIAKQKSQYQKERLVNLKREGFTDEQAIDIIKVEKTPFE
ncbi:hypothetical protein QI259_00480 [Staphylococcus saprophyticus]|uniref:hypothetical protein n=1 Tax=Staphylococcus saprophyticus TaxID=29385 RepID=UPI002977FB49|nr:hypothetical protein [Staphylococcus saprophyticus]